jgi:RNA polymerase sigma-70 factor (ECF subfamily)
MMNRTPWIVVSMVSEADVGSDEKEILDKVLNGHTSAYGEIFARHRARAFTLAYQYLHNSEDAMDVVQDAFIRAYQNLTRFDRAKSFRPWLLAIVRNLSIDLIRKRRRISDDGLPAVIPDKSSRSADEKLLKNEVWAALLRLNNEQREIIFLKDYQGHSYAEIAEILSIPLGTVMSRLHHARRKLIAAVR